MPDRDDEKKTPASDDDLDDAHERAERRRGTGRGLDEPHPKADPDDTPKQP